MNVTSNSAAKTPKRTMLPLLILLFLISYGLLTTLVVEQDRTIDSQRSLIHLLFKDNVHLSALRGSKNRLGYAADAAAPHAQSPQAQPSRNQTPLIEVPSNQVPSSRAKAQASAKGEKTRKAQKQLPVRPPAEMTDPSDTRRVSFSI